MGTLLITFIEKTWFLWWIFAIMIILRWFSAASVDPHLDAALEEFPRNRQSGEGAIGQQFVAKAS
jgi:hypothetical protein